MLFIFFGVFRNHWEFTDTGRMLAQETTQDTDFYIFIVQSCTWHGTTLCLEHESALLFHLWLQYWWLVINVVPNYFIFNVIHFGIINLYNSKYFNIIFRFSLVNANKLNIPVYLLPNNYLHYEFNKPNPYYLGRKHLLQ